MMREISKNFDVVAAKKNDASEFIITAATEYNEAAASTGEKQIDDRALSIGFPIHGNWCGPGHSGPDAHIDLLDSRCKTHDLCYANEGYFHKSCDRALVAQLTLDLHAGQYSGWVKAKAIAIRSVFLPNAAP
ncbi:hypothetical protein P4N68_05285 [Corynebacterium felinum]|uniref:Phospholipase A2 n=1 Tax=Corynebacterium felinum TaxID=131318 RepID=A0ABU2B8Q8_9CORY|nr:hypothetical protein [Corynebacterium felinum]MDF5820493.1 hypothetical protein [Corynebacterium felinum]MDR7354771.1 hypothetical protein [Corynebacterium felinum]WJY94133.1 hypothetical protein CFELI_02455 [Corynebacterium felinum]